jgi:hypothetical protein
MDKDQEIKRLNEIIRKKDRRIVTLDHWLAEVRDYLKEMLCDVKK